MAQANNRAIGKTLSVRQRKTMDRKESDGYQKAKAILAEAFADRVDRLDPERPATGAMAAIQAALTDEFGTDTAADIAFHMADWNSDAAFILALHLFPERFTKDEIDSGVRDFLVHAPNHVAEAAKLIGFPVSDIFKENK